VNPRFAFISRKTSAREFINNPTDGYDADGEYRRQIPQNAYSRMIRHISKNFYFTPGGPRITKFFKNPFLRTIGVGALICWDHSGIPEAAMDYLPDGELKFYSTQQHRLGNKPG
jgi:hypothetical protein